jgi:hypothetical protein
MVPVPVCFITKVAIQYFHKKFKFFYCFDIKRFYCFGKKRFRTRITKNLGLDPRILKFHGSRVRKKGKR